MLPRLAASTVQRMLRGFPIVTITGPRQSGKTTLARAVFAGRPYASLEDPDIRMAAHEDPRSFLARFPDGAVLDEIQRAPDLFSYLQTKCDLDGRMGLYLLTGSQQFGLLSRISQSLAGRTAFVELLPFALGELDAANRLPESLDAILLSGLYPPLYDRPIPPADWFRAYVTAYVERDVRLLVKVQELDTFQRFLRLCAGRTAQLLNLSSLATECGITHNTAKAWISVLEASYIVFLLRPHHANFNKRLVKTPKIYFYDAGLVSWLLGIQTAGQMETHPLRGNIFETFILAELMKEYHNRGERPPLFFWRDGSGNEVDVVVEQGAKLMPLEIKSGQTLTRDSFKGLEKWLALAGETSGHPALVYGGKENYARNGVQVAGWRDAVSLLL